MWHMHGCCLMYLIGALHAGTTTQRRAALSSRSARLRASAWTRLASPPSKSPTCRASRSAPPATTMSVLGEYRTAATAVRFCLQMRGLMACYAGYTMIMQQHAC